jgi:ABC-type transport system involved in multi-copper enzyme maturation permease subunit
MVRNILGVVLGYVAMFAFVFISFTVLYLILGADGSFEPGTYEVSLIWIIISFILGLAAAVLGGYLCVLISKNQKTALVLAGLVLLLGIAMAIPALGNASNEDQEMRRGDVPNMEAMQNAKQPVLMLLLNPIVGAIGVYVGSKLRKKAKE